MKNSKVLKNDTRCHIIEYDLFLIRDQRLHKDCGVIVSCRGNTLSYEKNHIQTKNHIRDPKYITGPEILTSIQKK